MTPRMLRTTRRLPKETWQLERFLELDGQGLPSYADPVEFEADVTESQPGRRTAGGSSFLTMPDGSEVKVARVLYVQGDADEVPDEQDRVTSPSGRKYIVGDRTGFAGLSHARDSSDHYRLRCAEE